MISQNDTVGQPFIVQICLSEVSNDIGMLQTVCGKQTVLQHAMLVTIPLTGSWLIPVTITGSLLIGQRVLCTNLWASYMRLLT